MKQCKSLSNVPQRLLFAFAALLSVSINTLAADKAGNYAIWGLGGSSCFAFLKAQDAQKVDAYRTYLMGYLTAFNTLSEDTYSATGAQPLPVSIRSLRRYCAEHQMDSFDRAIQQTLGAIYSSRQRESPGSKQPWGRPGSANPR